jgi:DNA helicase II / ATP-dependent DNA helicase PcrA
LAANGAVLFIAGDDDQSIYSFRHADPTGIVNFNVRYPHSTTHVLDECFRCTPNVLVAASAMIAVNPARLAKNIISLYQNAAPPVMGRTLVWSFPTEQDEAAAVAESCQRLINSGMGGREDEIVILISDSGLQLGIIAQALGNLGLAYDPPRGAALTDDDGIRAVYCMFRIAKDLATAQPDYVAHRALLGLLNGVGMTTAKGIADACVGHHQNFHDLFRLPAAPHWLTARQSAAVGRIIAIANAVACSQMTDTLANRGADIAQQLGNILMAHRGKRDWLLGMPSSRPCPQA